MLRQPFKGSATEPTLTNLIVTTSWHRNFVTLNYERSFWALEIRHARLINDSNFSILLRSFDGKFSIEQKANFSQPRCLYVIGLWRHYLLNCERETWKPFDNLNSYFTYSLSNQTKMEAIYSMLDGVTWPLKFISLNVIVKFYIVIVAFFGDS